MDSFEGYERFYLEIEFCIENAVRQNHPRPWDENNITHNILAGLRQLGPKIKINRRNRDAVNVHWDFFKLTGSAEQQYGDVAFIIRMHQKDGQYTDGLGVIEAKKINATKDEYTELLGARKDQLQKQVGRLPYALVALYDHEDMAQLTAAMLLIPEFQQNSLRLEAFLHLAAIGCKGTDLPTRDHLQKSLTRLTPASMAQHEDPPTDVFVGLVNSHLGSFRFFLGSYDDGDFWVERLLNFLAEKQNFPLFPPIVRSTTALLGLSDAVAKRLQLDPYTTGIRREARQIIVPRWNEMLPRINALYFSQKDLQDLQIDQVDLAPFVLEDPMRDELLNQTLWSSIFEAKPLLHLSGGLLLGAPSSLARTAVRFMADQIQRSGMGGWAESFYDQETAHAFGNLCGLRLQSTPLRFEPPVVADLMNMFPYFGRIDDGRAAIMLTVNPPFLSEVPLDVESIDRLSLEDVKRIDDYLLQCTTKLEKDHGVTGGLVLVCLGGFGRPMALPIKSPPPGWILHLATLAEWNTLLSSGECTAMRLQRLGEHEQLADQHGVTIQNLWGLLELFAYWQSNGFRLIPQDTELHNMSMLMLDGSFSFGFNERVRRLLNVHCVTNHKGTEIARLERFEPNSSFKDDRNQNVYLDTNAYSDGRIAGCVETIHRSWWVTVWNSDVPASQRHTVYELWKCVLHWMRRLSSVAEDLLSQLPAGSIAVHLDFLDLPRWSAGEEANLGMPLTQDLQSEATQATKTINLRIPEGFLSHFNQPKNYAERTIVRTILEGLYALSDVPLSSDNLDMAVLRVMPNEDARHFHVLVSQDIRRLLNSDSPRRPRFIAEEDISFSQLGLGFLGKSDGPRSIKGKKDCQDFLEKVVTTLWERIESKLKQFNLLSVATKCSRAIIELERDKDHWVLSSRALLALHPDTEDAHEVITKRNSTRALATMCNRLLIEIAEYSANVEGGRELNSDDQLSMLADCSNLLIYAQHRDAISYGFMDAIVQISPNGELLVDMGFYDKVMIQYISKHSERETAQAAIDYDEYFEPIKPTNPDDAAKPLPVELAKLNEAFKSEYIVDLQTYFKIGNALATLAMEGGNDALLLNDLGWMKLLKDQCQVPLETGRELLKTLQLPIRSGFDKDFPSGCHLSDTFPWRFRRKLSLLSRPLMQVRGKPGNWLTFATSFDTSIKYLVGHIERGALPQNYFKSKEMRTYMGEVAHKLGHKFTAKVAQIFIDAGLKVRTEVEMSTLGTAKNAGLGDVDVLAWNPSSGWIFVVECKRLRPALTVREVVQRLEEFKGDQKELDSLGRHTRRVDWLLINLGNLAQFCGMPVDQVSLISVLATSDIVPMQFFENLNFPSEQVVPFEKLANFISSR